MSINSERPVDSDFLELSPSIRIPVEQIELSAIRAQGKGGQNVNKVSSAIHLRFNFRDSSLPEYAKSSLFRMRDSRITQEGDIVLKAQNYRTQGANRRDALERLRLLLLSALDKPKLRIKTKISYGAKLRRQDAKKKQSLRKNLRKKVQVRKGDF